jgi:hypothetical protein
MYRKHPVKTSSKKYNEMNLIYDQKNRTNRFGMAEMGPRYNK